MALPAFSQPIHVWISDTYLLTKASGPSDKESANIKFIEAVNLKTNRSYIYYDNPAFLTTEVRDNAGYLNLK